MAEPEHGSSPLAEALARVGDRLTLLVVEALLPGPRRFNDLLSQIPGIAANILSDRLKRLERDRLLVARDRKSTRLNSSHVSLSRMPSSA